MPLSNEQFLKLFEEATKHIISNSAESKQEFHKLIQLELKSLHKIQCKIKLGHLYMAEGDSEKSKYYLEKAIKIARTEGYNRELADALNEMGNLEMDLGDFEKAVEVCNTAMEIYQKLGLYEEEYKARTTKAFALFYTGDLDQSLANFQINIDKNSEIKIGSLQKARVFNNVGIVYDSQGHFDKAIDSYEKALAFCKEISYTRGICLTLGNLGENYTRLGEMKKAEQSFIEGLSIAEKDQNLKNNAYIGQMYANFLINRGDLDKAKIYLDKSMVYFKVEVDPKVQVQSLYLYGLYWLMKGNTTKTLEKLEEALKLITKYHVTDSIVDVLTSLSDIHLGNRNFDEAYKYLMEADKNSWLRKSEFDYAKVLIQKARIQLVSKSLVDAEMNLLRANWIAKLKQNIIVQINSLLLLTLTNLVKFQTTNKSEYYDVAFKHITKAHDFAKERNLIPKLINTLIIQGMLFGIKKDMDNVKGCFTEAISLAEKYSIPNLIQSANESYKFALGQFDAQKGKSDPESTHSFSLQIAIDQIKNTTRTFNQRNLKPEDLKNVYLVLFKVDEIMGPDVVLADNLDPDDDRWYKDLLLSSSLYASALGQGHKYHEGLFGLLPFGGSNLRAMIYATMIKDPSQKSERSSGMAYYLFTLLFPEEFKHIFMDRQKLEEIFTQEIKSLEDATQITQEKMRIIRTQIIQKLTDYLL